MPTKTCICGREFEARASTVLTCSADCRRTRRLERALVSGRARYAANPERYREQERRRRAANPERYREFDRERQRELGFLQSFSYQLLRRQGVALDHLPSRSSRLWFPYRLLRSYPGLLPTTTDHPQQEHNDV
jgi:hypothetical protein